MFLDFLYVKEAQTLTLNVLHIRLHCVLKQTILHLSSSLIWQSSFGGCKTALFLLLLGTLKGGFVFVFFFMIVLPHDVVLMKNNDTKITIFIWCFILKNVSCVFFQNPNFYCFKISGTQLVIIYFVSFFWNVLSIPFTLICLYSSKLFFELWSFSTYHF